MTDRDVLKRASDALRESTEPSADELAKLRARLLGGGTAAGNVVSLAKAQKRKTMRWVFPLAAAFVAGTALAATPGAWEGLLQGVERFLDIELLAPSHEAMPAEKPGKTRRSASGAMPAESVAAQPVAAAPAEAESVVEEPIAAQPVVAEPAPLAPANTRTRTRSATSTRPPATSAEEPTREKDEAVTEAGSAQAVAEAEPTGPSRDVTLYKTAHELHFGAQRYDEALRAWESYLALPSPTFTLEARYNRALCLLKLGHFEEARAALRPFAEGRVLGSYRRDQASRLIQALDKRR
jgi:tetratricopeptide (TPR) repeat protein